VFAIFERIGGRCVAAWSLANNGQVIQVVGNPLSEAEFETEEEGSVNQNPDGSVHARRTSAFKDWFADGSGGGTGQYVNALYGVASTPGGWVFSSPDGAVVKTVTLATGSDALVAEYVLSGVVNKLFVRFGLSPDLDTLLTEGQAGLSIEAVSGGVEVTNVSKALSSTALVGLDSNVIWQAAATDDDAGNQDTVPMRNQSQVQQVEVESQATSFTESLSRGTMILDDDEDGLPSAWEASNGLDDDDAFGNNGALGDPDGDGVDNTTEWLLGMNPQVSDRSAFPRLGITRDGSGTHLSFPTIPDRVYQWESSDDLNDWDDHGEPASTEGAGGPSTLTLDEATAAPRRFYRMTVRGL
jgi:hypothetical protein